MKLNSTSQSTDPWVLNAHIHNDGKTQRPRHEYLVAKPYLPKNSRVAMDDVKDFYIKIGITLLDWAAVGGYVKLLDFHAEGGRDSMWNLYAAADTLQFRTKNCTDANAVPLPVARYARPIILDREFIIELYANVGGNHSKPAGKQRFTKWKLDGEWVGKDYWPNVWEGEQDPYLQIGLDGLRDNWPEGVYSRRAEFRWYQST